MNTVNDEHGEIRAQNRGSWVNRRAHSQFNPMWAWIAQRKPAFTDALQNNRILFGEWCFAVHPVQYDRLPDWFLGFDVYDLERGRFWSTPRRDELLKLMGICRVPRLRVGRTTLTDLQDMLRSEKSGVGKGGCRVVGGARKAGPSRVLIGDRRTLVRPAAGA